jgi:hypothetical protein
LLDKNLTIRDNGTLSCRPCEVISKKFKFHNTKPDTILNIKVFSSMPSLLSIKTPAVSI